MSWRAFEISFNVFSSYVLLSINNVSTTFDNILILSLSSLLNCLFLGEFWIIFFFLSELFSIGGTIFKLLLFEFDLLKLTFISFSFIISCISSHGVSYEYFLIFISIFLIITSILNCSFTLSK